MQENKGKTGRERERSKMNETLYSITMNHYIKYNGAH